MECVTQLSQKLGGKTMPELAALEEKIRQLIIKRREAHGNDAEQDRINAKLTKLYDRKWLLLKQRGN